MQTEFLSNKHLLADVWQFEFKKPANFEFVAGDFCELELGDEIHGGARWLTIACSPSENNLTFITKIPDNPSVFKGNLASLKRGKKAWLSPALGMFHLPRKTEEKVLFIALGLGITPYKSMLTWASEQKLNHDAKLLYWAKSGQHLKDIAGNPLQITAKEYPISLASLNKLCEDWRKRIIYLSGPEPVCMDLYKKLRDEQIPLHQIKLDYFEGYFEI
jgi:ferredoxin-NADP reductase